MSSFKQQLLLLVVSGLATLPAVQATLPSLPPASDRDIGVHQVPLSDSAFQYRIQRIKQGLKLRSFKQLRFDDVAGPHKTSDHLAFMRNPTKEEYAYADKALKQYPTAQEATTEQQEHREQALKTSGRTHEQMQHDVAAKLAQIGHPPVGYTSMTGETQEERKRLQDMHRSAYDHAYDLVEKHPPSYEGLISDVALRHRRLYDGPHSMEGHKHT